MKFPCPHCDATLEALPEHEGAKADCALCGGKFIVPAADRPATKIAGIDPGELLARGLQSIAPPDADGWEPPEPEELSRLLPQYKIESILGHGGMGAVYKGSQARLGRNVAIKLLPAELAEDENFVARFEREARTLAKLDHPGIVHVYDFGQTSEGHLYFVMEFVDGTDLHQMIHGPGLTPQQVLEIIGQVCDALQFAHSKGVVHRDIKPANILVTQDGRVKLADFGLARPMQSGISGQLTLTRVIMGTPDYMAPEQKRGEGDHRVDLYALGVMLYEMLCGKTPQGAWQPPSQRVQVDVRLDQVVIKAMQEEPERRYQQASEVKTDVDVIRTALLSSKAPPAPKHRKKEGDGHKPPLQAPGSSVIAPAKEKPSKNKAALIAAVVLIPLLIAGGWLTLRPKAPATPAIASSSPVPPIEDPTSPPSVPALSALKWNRVLPGNYQGNPASGPPLPDGTILLNKDSQTSNIPLPGKRGAVRLKIDWRDNTFETYLALVSSSQTTAHHLWRRKDHSRFGQSENLPAKELRPGDSTELCLVWTATEIAAFCDGKEIAREPAKFQGEWRTFVRSPQGTRDKSVTFNPDNYECIDLSDLSDAETLSSIPSLLSKSSSTVAKSSPSALDSLPSLEAAKWQSVHNGPEFKTRVNDSTPAFVKSFDSDGWGTLDLKSSAYINHLRIPFARFAVRIKIQWMERSTDFHFALGSSGARQRGFYVTSGKVAVVDGSRQPAKKTFNHPFKPGDIVNLMVVHTGREQHFIVNGEKIAALPADEGYTSLNGRVGPFHSSDNQIRFRHLEWIDLSGVPENRMLDVALKADPSSASAPAKASPVWEAAYGNHLRITLPENSPGADGWITLNKSRLEPVIPVGSGSYAVRARVGWLENSEQLQILNWVGDERPVIAGVGKTVGGVWRGNEGGNIPHPAPLTAGSEVSIRFAWIDGKYYGWINNKPVGPLDVARPAGKDGTLIFQNVTTTPLRIRDIEIIDLSTLGKEEALSLVTPR